MTTASRGEQQLLGVPNVTSHKCEANATVVAAAAAAANEF